MRFGNMKHIWDYSLLWVEGRKLATSTLRSECAENFKVGKKNLSLRQEEKS